VLSKSISLPCISVSEMAARGRPQLTKKQIHEAVSLINECLSDQQTHDSFLAPLSPYDKSYFSFSKAKSSTKIASTENLLENPDQIFSNIIFAPAISGRTDELDVLDDVIAELASGKVSNRDAVDGSTSRETTEKDESEPEAEGSNPGREDKQQSATSCSDVDSGIDGSALAGSTSSEVKMKSTMPESVASFVDADSDPAPQQLTSNVVANLESIEDPGKTLMHEETAEERRVREEIELMEKRLERLQEKQVI